MEVGQPDTPFSLGIGLIGDIFYLSDLLIPESSRFPYYDIF